jgi:HPt (histidine-containing phosphotransfer) domain-containing protein
LSWAIFHKMLLFFPEGQNKIIKDLKSAVKTKDLEKIKYLAHSLVGAAGTVAANDLISSARELEIAAKEKHKEVAGLFEQLEKEYKKVCDSILLLPPLKENDLDSGKAKMEILPPEEILSYLEKMKKSLNEFDPVYSSELMDRLNKVSLPDAIDQDIIRLTKFIDELQFDEACKIVDKITEILNQEVGK